MQTEIWNFLISILFWVIPISIIVSLLRWGGKRMLRYFGFRTWEPNLTIKNIYDSANNDADTIWWHIDIRNCPHDLWWENFISVRDAIDCTIRLHFCPMSHCESFDDPGIWAQQEGSKEKLTLRLNGEIGRIPIALMSSKEREWDKLTIEPFRTYMTGKHFVIDKTDNVNVNGKLERLFILKPSVYKLSLRIYSLGVELFRREFRLSIPKDDLDKFLLTPLGSR